MQIELLYRPAFSLGIIHLDGGEEVRVEAASMVSMSQGITLETAATGGILRSLGRAVLGGESFFQNTYLAPPEGGRVGVAPALTGDLMVIDMQDEMLMVQSGSYLASATTITTDNEKRDAHLKSKDFFEVEKFPEAKFVSDKVEVNGNTLKVHGSLTIRGVSKPVVLDATLTKGAPNPMSKKKTAGFSASTTVKRSEFGINYALPAVSDEVKVEIEVEATLAQE